MVSVDENGVNSSSSSTSSTQIPDPLSPPLENQLRCHESFSDIIMKDEEEEAVSSDASASNCTGFELHERKRSRADDAEEDGNVMEEDAVSDGNKSRRIHEEEGEKEVEGQKGNQESGVADEGEGGNQEKNNEEEKEAVRNQLGELLRENEGSENNVNDENSEENGSVNQELEGDEAGEENGENDENQEENDDNKDDEEEEDAEKEDDDDEDEEEEDEDKDERQRRADEKGKQPMSELYQWEYGGPSSGTHRGYQIQHDDTESSDHEPNNDDDYDYHRDLAILRSLWNFKINNGHLPYPHSEELHNFIMHSIPNLQIHGERLTDKIMELEEDFNTSWELDEDNPRPVDREIYNLSMALWDSSSEDDDEKQSKTASSDED